jgi:DNA-binding NarL/FixJ family response regulator
MIIAGLICENAEVFKNDGEMHTIYNSKRVGEAEMPQIVKDIIDENITPEHHAELDKMGVDGAEARRIQWSKCNLAALDGKPDIVISERTIIREYHPCPKRETCNSSGKLCITLEQLTGLTPTEILVLGYHGEALLNKEIADRTGTTEATVKIHNKNIQRKLGLQRKPDLAIYADRTLNFKNQ